MDIRMVRTASVLALIVVASTMTARATFPKITWVYRKITLGARQMATTIEYTGARMTSKNEIAYDAKVDGQARSVVYRFDPPGRRLTVTVAGGTAPVAFSALVKNEALNDVPLSLALERISFTLMSSGRVIATSSAKGARDAGGGTATGLYYAKTERFDALSMDVMLHLPTEFPGTRPQDLFGTQIAEAHAAGVATVFKKLLEVFSGGMKYSRDCETTTSGPAYACSAVCSEGAEGGARPQCPCSMCGPICCSDGCTVTEGTTTRNCSATFEVGAQGS